MNGYSFTPESDTDHKKTFASFSELTQKLLLERDITTQDEAEAFLSPQYDLHTHDPFLLKDVDKACERILKALQNNEKIIIFSDYDTDGIPGGVILHDFFKQIGYTNFENYIPHRNLEGFGLNTSAVQEFAEKKVNLIITIDCGITDVEEVALANSLGIDVIITDHHLPHDAVPNAIAIVNPKQSDCMYPFKELCGSGVMYKLIQALIKKGKEDDGLPAIRNLGVGWEKWLLDMVGIATISDMVPLVGENRVFAHFGLLVLRKSPRPGLLTLLNKTRTSQKHLSEEDIGFTIGPRINAASRMDEPILAFNLLSTQDPVLASAYFDELDHLNNERKGHVANIVKSVKKKLHEREVQPNVICTGHPDWKPGLLGLACNTLAEEYSRPVFLWGREGGKSLKGSCRSDGSASVVELMRELPENTFVDFGGHTMSGGFTVTDNAVHTLEMMLSEAHTKVSTNHVVTEKAISHRVRPLDISWALYDEVARFAPFGTGNPRPLFLIEDAFLQSVSLFGKTKNHLKLIIGDADNFVAHEAIAFFKTDKNFKKEMREGEKISLVGYIEKSTFGYKPQIRIRIIDILI